MQHRFQNITCQAEQAIPKGYLPRWHFPLPLPLRSKKVSYIARTPPKTLLAERGKLGLVLLAHLPFFVEFTCNLQHWASGYNVARCLEYIIGEILIRELPTDGHLIFHKIILNVQFIFKGILDQDDTFFRNS